MILKYPIKIARKIVSGTPFKKNSPYEGHIEYWNENANNLVRSELMRNKPLMICKFGSTELGCIRNYLSIREPKKISNAWKYIKREKKSLWWWDWGNEMAKQSGFFPPTDDMLERFSELMLEDIKEIDILCSYLKHEDLLNEELSQAKRINTEGLVAPFRYENPWTELLEGKKILVVHPFEESINNQYKKRLFLFNNPKVLPAFELKTIKAVQTIANNPSKEFKNWFAALDYMKERISSTDFDIALIGCGAYGLPLAAHVKRMGKKGIHMASYTQILFGIYGKRWEEIDEYANLINQYWVRPLPSEVPPNYKKVEGGAYW